MPGIPRHVAISKVRKHKCTLCNCVYPGAHINTKNEDLHLFEVLHMQQKPSTTYYIQVHCIWFSKQNFNTTHVINCTKLYLSLFALKWSVRRATLFPCMKSYFNVPVSCTNPPRASSSLLLLDMPLDLSLAGLIGRSNGLLRVKMPLFDAASSPT